MEFIQVVMVRPDLADLPQHELPAGYALRLYRPGDKRSWLRIQRRAERFLDITGKTFDANFGDDLPAMEKRSFFLVSPDGRDIGTTTAWYDRNYAGKAWGRVHWVAIVPEFQGRGLAKPMLSAVMNRMKALGHRRAVLGTQTPRLPAIKVYLDFGFRPDMTTADADRAWRLVRERLPHPALKRLGR